MSLLSTPHSGTNVKKWARRSQRSLESFLQNFRGDNKWIRVTVSDAGALVSFIPPEDYWKKVLFGYSIAENVFTVKAGQIHFRDKIYAVAEKELAIAADLTYVYVEMEWGTGISSLKQTTTIANATASSSCFRKWLYLLNYTAPSSVSVKTYGHTGGAISIMPVFG